MLRRLRSFIASIRAGAAVGRASGFERKGLLAEAVMTAKDGLSGLRQPYVNRSSPPEGAALASLTIILERLSEKANADGAEVTDLEDSLSFLKRLPSHEGIQADDLRSWIPYLEAKLAKTRGHA
jgi:hypothetical protein